MVKKMFFAVSVLLWGGVMNGAEWREDDGKQHERLQELKQLQLNNDEILALHEQLREAGRAIEEQAGEIQQLQMHNDAIKGKLQELRRSICVVGIAGAAMLLRCWLKQCGECK